MSSYTESGWLPAWASYNQRPGILWLRAWVRVLDFGLREWRLIRVYIEIKTWIELTQRALGLGFRAESEPSTSSLCRWGP